MGEMSRADGEKLSRSRLFINGVPGAGIQGGAAPDQIPTVPAAEISINPGGLLMAGGEVRFSCIQGRKQLDSP